MDLCCLDSVRKGAVVKLLFWWLITFVCTCIDANAQDSHQKLKILPLPFVGTSPSTGFLVGVAPGAYWMMGDKSNTSLSNALGSAMYTEKKQLLFTLKATTFFSGDKWNMITDFRYFDTSQPTYGLGTGPQWAKPVGYGGLGYAGNPSQPIETAQPMAFDFIRLHNTVLKRISDSRLFVGGGYHLDSHYHIDDKMLDLSANPQVVTSHYGYSIYEGFNPEHYVLSGMSLDVLLDSRDNVVNPYHGLYAYAHLRGNNEWLGSTKNSSLLWLEFRDYINFSKVRPRHLLGFWGYGWFVTGGQVPYLDLPAVGWDQFGRSGRAYTQGRFRGEDLIYSEFEYRVPLQRHKETIGAVAFVNSSTASNRNGNISLYQYVDFGYGVGLRIMINKASRANLNIDYAFGKYGAQGLYVALNEVF
jgi:hypothetical protein